MKDSEANRMNFFRHIAVALTFAVSAAGFVAGCGAGKTNSDDKSAAIKGNDTTNETGTGGDDGSGTK